MASSSSGPAAEVTIHNVYMSNVEEEFGRIRGFVEDYPYIAMDTEFPGVVATPLGTFRSKEDFNYQQVYCNVNMLKLIQVCQLFCQNLLYFLFFRLVSQW